MSRIVFKSSIVDEKIDKLVKLNNNLDEDIKKLCNSIKILNNYWESPVSAKYVKEYADYSEKINSMREQLLAQYINLLKDINVEYNVIEDSNKNFSERFL